MEAGGARRQDFTVLEPTFGTDQQADRCLGRRQVAQADGNPRCANQTQSIFLRGHAKVLRQIKNRRDGGNPVAPGLLTGGNGDIAPVFDAALGAFTGEPDHAAFGGHRLDAPYAEFDCLLHHEIHFVAGRQGLHQGQVERRLAVDVFEAVQRGAQALAGRVEAGLPLAAAPIEQYRRVASADSQDFQGMVRRVRRQLDMRTGMQGEWAEEPRYHGRIIPKSRMQRMASLSPPVCDFGRPAIDFDLPGVDGRRHTLASTRGSNGLLVMFICNHCPYVKAVLDRIIRDARELAALGVGSIAVMSNDPGEYPEDSWDNMLRLARELDFPFPYVLDESQAVARAYGAVCTPDFFGYNAKLELQYRGRLDESRKEAASPTVRRELFEAMRAVAETGLGPRQQIPSIGCSIKWCEA